VGRESSLSHSAPRTLTSRAPSSPVEARENFPRFLGQVEGVQHGLAPIPKRVDVDQLFDPVELNAFNLMYSLIAFL